MSGIFLMQPDGDLLEMKEQPYDTEYVLQELLAKHPNLLAGDQIDGTSPRKWLLVSREVGVPCDQDGSDRWFLDHLFLDQDAIPTLIEVKRSSDNRIRRAVVGQMLDYAANAVVYWPVEMIRARFQQECATKGVDPRESVENLLGDDGDVEDFWVRVKTNLQAGRVRMVFVADEVPPELRRIVEFLNGQMNPAEVLAVEVKQFVGKGLKTLVPRLIGQTAEAERKKSAGSSGREPRWTDWEAALAAIENKPIADFYRQEIAEGRDCYLPRRALRLKVGGRRRWVVRAHAEGAHVSQMARFEGDTEYWRSGLGKDADVKPIKGGRVLRFYLFSEDDVRFFRQAVKDKAMAAWTETLSDDEADSEG